mmetsp:Transcript_52739/g.136179  ORF Transcript_52739/g.136179 Transcript_52739/m.136179 type:complete len:145 (+) Transcript_52739:74-508(+)
MPAARRSPVLLPLLAVCVSLLAVCRLAFVGAPRDAAIARSSLRASKDAASKEEAESYTLPKPNMDLINENAQVGLTFDQDKRGNMWAVEQQPVRKSDDEQINTAIFFPLLIIGTFVGITFFAVLTGNDPRFGGGIGDGSFAVGD